MRVPLAQLPAKVQLVVHIGSRSPEQTFKHCHFSREGGKQLYPSGEGRGVIPTGA